MGSRVSYASLSRQIGISHVSIRRWVKWLTSLYYCFEVRPWAHNLARALTKEPKYYMTDWSMVEDPGARAKNFVASHLLKAVHFWTDFGVGVFTLHYLRDRLKREVDFLVARNGRPWLLIEVKLNHSYAISPALAYFQSQLAAPYALQAVISLKQTHEPCFLDPKPKIVPAISFLSQLV